MSFCDCSRIFREKKRKVFCAAIISHNDKPKRLFHGNDKNATKIIRLLSPLELSEALTEQEIFFLRYFFNPKVSNSTQEDPVPSHRLAAQQKRFFYSLYLSCCSFSSLVSSQSQT
jgi:hypothetical protein